MNVLECKYKAMQVQEDSHIVHWKILSFLKKNTRMKSWGFQLRSLKVTTRAFMVILLYKSNMLLTRIWSTTRDTTSLATSIRPLILVVSITSIHWSRAPQEVKIIITRSLWKWITVTLVWRTKLRNWIKCLKLLSMIQTLLIVNLLKCTLPDLQLNKNWLIRNHVKIWVRRLPRTRPRKLQSRILKNRLLTRIRKVFTYKTHPCWSLQHH